MCPTARDPPAPIGVTGPRATYSGRAQNPDYVSGNIIRDDQRRHSTQKLEAAPVGADPVRQPLAPGGFDVGVVAGPQHRHEDLRLAHLPGAPVHHRHRLPGIVHEQFLARHIVLAQHRLQGTLPAPVELTELAVLIAVGVGRPILLPEQPQGHPFAAQLLVDRRPLRQGAPAGGFRRGRIQQPLQLLLVHPLRQGPAQPRCFRPQQGISHRGPGPCGN